MADQPHALSAASPDSPVDGDYDAICAAMSATERGRRFLQEYARRNAKPDILPLADAVADVMASAQRLQQIAQTLHEQGTEPATAAQIAELAAAICAGSAWRNGSGRQAQELAQILRHLETRMAHLVEATTDQSAPATAVPAEPVNDPLAVLRLLSPEELIALFT